MQIRVFYEDTDCGGVVYHSNYLNFCERARSDLFFQKGLSPHISETEFFVVKHIEADFIKSAKFGDLIEVKTNISKIKSASLEMYQEIYKDEELLFTAKIKLAYLKDFKPAKIPTNLLDFFTVYTH